MSDVWICLHQILLGTRFTSIHLFATTINLLFSYSIFFFIWSVRSSHALTSYLFSMKIDSSQFRNTPTSNAITSCIASVCAWLLENDTCLAGNDSSCYVTLKVLSQLLQYLHVVLIAHFCTIKQCRTYLINVTVKTRYYLILIFFKYKLCTRIVV